MMEFQLSAFKHIGRIAGKATIESLIELTQERNGKVGIIANVLYRHAHTYTPTHAGMCMPNARTANVQQETMDVWTSKYTTHVDTEGISKFCFKDLVTQCRISLPPHVILSLGNITSTPNKNGIKKNSLNKNVFCFQTNPTLASQMDWGTSAQNSTAWPASTVFFSVGECCQCETLSFLVHRLLV